MTAYTKRHRFVGERRKHHRYPIALQVHYTTQFAPAGSGEVSDISSSGLRFRSGCIFPVGGQIEATLPWPFLLKERCRLQLYIRGHIVRSDGKGTAVKIDQYEFRTAGRILTEDHRALVAV